VLELREKIHDLRIRRKSCYDHIQGRDAIRQPEVSAAMRVLRANKWISEREEKKKTGKGRPVKVYKLGVPLRQIVELLESDKLVSNEETMSDIQRLRELA
jgi:predicted transcriptional regulator